jgi:predicted DCC family thiol-disulfide oxidoreductase YuxK
MASSNHLVYSVKMNSKQKIIFFDGDCGLCDRFVTEIFVRDKNHQFRFAPLQGPTARHLLRAPPTVDSIVYLRHDVVLVKSQAVLELLQDLGGFYSLFGFFKLVPRKFRDALYDYIARNRYGWFGQTQVCRLPQEEEKAYFFD